VVAVPAVSSLLSLTFTFVSDSFLVELNHLRAFIFVPERSVLRRNGGSASSAEETVAIGAFVRMKAMIMVISFLVSGVFLHDVVSSTRVSLFSFLASVGELFSFFPASLIPPFSFRFFVFIDSGFSIDRRILSILLEVISFRRLIFVSSSSSSGVITVEFSIHHAVLVGVVGSSVDRNKDCFLLGWSS
jgi:hypothetical protein